MVRLLARHDDARRILGWDRRVAMEHDNDEIERRRATMKRRIAGLLAGAFLAGALVVGGVSAAVANGLHGLHGPTQVPAAAVRGATSSGDGMGSVTNGYGSGMM